MTTAAEWLERIRALPLPPLNQGHECLRRTRTLDHDRWIAQGDSVEHRARARAGVPRLHLPRRGHLRGDPARAARESNPRRVRRHAARARQCAEERAALARAGQGRRRGCSRDRKPARRGENCARKPGSQSRVPRRRLRDHDGAGRGAARAGRAGESPAADVGPTHLACGLVAARIRRPPASKR